MKQIITIITIFILALSAVYAQTEACQDSDGGKDYYNKGTCFDSGNYASGGTDNCYVENGVTYLSELYCDSANLKCILETNYKCPYGCQNGACAKEAVEKVLCTDTDGGREYNKKGIVTWWVADLNEYRTSEDTCRETEEGNNLYSGTLLVENTCEGQPGNQPIGDASTLGTALSVVYYKCPYGCQDGACKTSSDTASYGKITVKVIDQNRNPVPNAIINVHLKSSPVGAAYKATADQAGMVYISNVKPDTYFIWAGASGYSAYTQAACPFNLVAGQEYTTTITLRLGGTSTDSCVTISPTPSCGNGVIESNEECDDGNTNNYNDGCLSNCLKCAAPGLRADVYGGSKRQCCKGLQLVGGICNVPSPNTGECLSDSDCKNLVCPMVVGQDTPKCSPESKKCYCGSSSTCTDSDGGENIYVAGSTNAYVDGVGKGTVDNCEFFENSQFGVLKEGVCINNKPDFVSIKCPAEAPYCRYGKCSNEDDKVCKETDGGDNPAVQGTMTEARYGDNLVQHTDYCEDIYTLQPLETCEGKNCALREYYCTEPFAYTTYRDVKCEKCSNGVCIGELPGCPQITKPWPKEGCRYNPKYDDRGCVIAYDEECKGQSFCGNGICEPGENELICEEIAVTQPTILPVEVEAKLSVAEKTTRQKTKVVSMGELEGPIPPMPTVTEETVNICREKAKLQFGQPIIEVYKFNGISTYIDMGDNTLSTADVVKGAISVWVKLGNPGNSQDTIIDFEGWLAMTVKPDGVLACCSDGICHDARSTVRVDDEQWHHVACTWDGKEFTKVYVDGQFAGSASPVQSPQLDNTQRNQRIGARSLNLDYFKGLIGRPTIWNRVFSDEEIKKLYLEGAPKDSNVLSIPCESTTQPTKCKFKCPQDCGLKPAEPPVVQPPINEETCEKKIQKCVEEFITVAQKGNIDYTTLTNKDELYSVCKRFACVEFQKDEEKKCSQAVMECAKKKTANAGGNSIKNMLAILEAIRICDKEIGCSNYLIPTPLPLPVEKCPTGCFYEQTYKCVPFGTRVDIKGPSYCELTGEFMAQKGNGDKCQNNWECTSNECGDGECRSTYKALQKILKWLSGLFGRAAVEKAVSEAAPEAQWALAESS